MKSQESKEKKKVKNSAELENLRRRLLDLTARNRLLNYKHPRYRSLRIIETDPGWLYDRLMNGDSVRIDHIPTPPKGSQLEQEWPEWVKEYSADSRLRAGLTGAG